MVVDREKADRIRARRAAGETYKEIAKGERVSFSEIAEVVFPAFFCREKPGN